METHPRSKQTKSTVREGERERKGRWREEEWRRGQKGRREGGRGGGRVEREREMLFR